MTNKEAKRGWSYPYSRSISSSDGGCARRLEDELEEDVDVDVDVDVVLDGVFKEAVDDGVPDPHRTPRRIDEKSCILVGAARSSG